MVAWFAGLFYLVRLFVYHIEAYEKEPEERDILQKQYHIMESRLYTIICRPAMIMTWLFGLGMIYIMGLEWLGENNWLHVKLALVVLLSAYSEYNGRIISRLHKGEIVMSAYRFRLFNEVPTLFLLAIVLLAVCKNMINFGYTFVAVILFAVVLMVFTKIYKRIRTKQKP